MLGLIKDFAITALIIILSHWIYGVADSTAYDFLVVYINENKSFFTAIGVLESITVVLMAAIFQSLGLSQLTFMISKLFARLCQFGITFFSILNIIFYASMSENIFRSGGYYIFLLLFFSLGASCWALRMIDFNHHTKNALVPVSVVGFVSVLLVQFIWPFIGF